ncbi:MAG: SRPBCC family protein [Methanosarcina sp.]
MGNTTKIIAEPEKQELFNIREFDASQELVFKAFTDPDLYSQWYGPRGSVMNIETFEPKNGGFWRYVLKDQKGNAYAFRGVYHEVAAPERIIDTVELEGLPEKGHAILRTNRFEALPDSKTRLIMQIVCQSVLDRDAMLSPKYEREVNESYNRLDELLEKMQKNLILK